MLFIVFFLTKKQTGKIWGVNSEISSEVPLLHDPFAGPTNRISQAVAGQPFRTVLVARDSKGRQAELPCALPCSALPVHTGFGVALYRQDLQPVMRYEQLPQYFNVPSGNLT